MAIPRLSKASEQRLTTALIRGQQLVEDGEEVNKALAKTASEENIPVGHIHFLVKAYNIGSSEAMRKSGQTLEEKTQEFEMADTDTILGHMFPDNAKSASAQRRLESVDDDYDVPPYWYTEKLKQAERAASLPARLKAAGICDEVDSVGIDPAKVRLKEWDKLTRISNEMTYEVERIKYHIDSSMNKIAQALASDPFLDVRSVADDVGIMWGERAKNLVDDMVKNSSALRKKIATADKFVKVAMPVDPDLTPYKYIKAVLDMSDTVDVLTKRLEQTTQELANLKQACRDNVWPDNQRHIYGVLPIKEGSSTKEANFFSVMSGAAATTLGREMMSQSPATKEKRDLESKALGELEDPRHSQELRSIKTESMLNDLLANDDIISGYDPSEVLNNYSELVQVAPHIADQSGIVRALLRRRLQQGSLDQFEIEQLLKIENYLKKRDNPMMFGDNNDPGMV